VVQENAHLAVGILLVAEGVLDRDLFAGRCAGEDVRAHCDRRVAVEVDLVVRELDVLPALAAVDGEAGVLLVALVDHAAADEVRHRLAARRAEGELCGLGRLEEHVGVAIAVELASAMARSSDIVAIREIGLADGSDCVRPR